MVNLQEILKALADETRFKIVELLLVQDFCVGALASNLGISRAAVSQHLQILRNAELVKGEKRGYWTHYVVNRGLIENAAAELNKMAAKFTGYKFKCVRSNLYKTNSPERGEKTMCQCQCNCGSQNKSQEKPEKCTPEQIKECHGDENNHPCENEKNK